MNCRFRLFVKRWTKWNIYFGTLRCLKQQRQSFKWLRKLCLEQSVRLTWSFRHVFLALTLSSADNNPFLMCSVHRRRASPKLLDYLYMLRCETQVSTPKNALWIRTSNSNSRRNVRFKQNSAKEILHAHYNGNALPRKRCNDWHGQLSLLWKHNLKACLTLV